MTADFAADIPAYPSPQIITEAKKLLSRGIEYARIREFERAIALFTRIIHLQLASSATIIKSYYHRGCALCGLKRYRKAIADFTQVIEHNRAPQLAIVEPNPDQTGPIKATETYIHRGNAHRHLGNHALALADLTQGIKQSGGSAQSYSCRGLLWLDMENFGNAIADFDRAIKEQPTFAQGYLWRGFAWLRSNQPVLALPDLDRAIEAIPNCAEAYNHRGVARFYLNYFEAALADFDRAIRIDSTLAEAYNNRGNLRQLMGDRTAAIVDFDTAVSLDASIAELYFNRAATLPTSTAEEVADIVADYTQTAGLPVNNAALYRHRARVRFEQGQTEAAIVDYTAAIVIAPTAYAHYHRGAAHLAVGNEEQALVDFDGAITLSPDYGQPYCDRALLRFKANNFQGALDDMARAIALNVSETKNLCTTRCLTHFCLGDREQALADFERLIELNLNRLPKPQRTLRQ